MCWRVLQLGAPAGSRPTPTRSGLLGEDHAAPESNDEQGENKYSVPNVCPQCQTVVTKKTAQDKGAAGGWYAEFWARLRRPGRSIGTGAK